MGFDLTVTSIYLPLLSGGRMVLDAAEERRRLAEVLAGERGRGAEADAESSVAVDAGGEHGESAVAAVDRGRGSVERGSWRRRVVEAGRRVECTTSMDQRKRRWVHACIATRRGPRAGGGLDRAGRATRRSTCWMKWQEPVARRSGGRDLYRRGGAGARVLAGNGADGGAVCAASVQREWAASGCTGVEM